MRSSAFPTPSPRRSLSGGLSLEEFTDAKLRSEEILDLAARVKTVLTPEFDHGPMDVKPQAVEIVMRDGKVFSEKVVYPKGNPNNPVSSEELVSRVSRHGELCG